MLKYLKQMNREKTLAKYIPYSAHVDERTLVTHEGDYLRIFKIDGIPFETADLNWIQKKKDDLNTLWRSVGSEQVALWTHQVRRRIDDHLNAEYDNPFCKQLNDKYYASFKD